MSAGLIFVLEDEEDIRILIESILKRSGFETESFEKGSELLKAVERKRPDLILLDLMLPDIDGLDLCEMIKSDSRFKDTPIIAVTARTAVDDRVKGLEKGADDYIPKPFSPKELVARVRAVLRRYGRNESGVLTAGKITLDPGRREVTVDGKIVNLTHAEFNLLHTFMKEPGIVFTRERLIEKMWAGEKYVTERTVDVHVANLRKKLGKEGERIESVRGVGYRFRS